MFLKLPYQTAVMMITFIACFSMDANKQKQMAQCCLGN